MRAEYLAGVFDGEGSIGFYRLGQQYVVTVAVEMCCKEIIEMFHKEFGGTYYPRTRKKGVKLQYSWVIRAKAAEGFLKVMGHRLVEKKPQAELALEIRGYQTANKRRTDVEKLERYVDEMKALKRV